MSGIKYTDLNEFLSKHSAKNSEGGAESTHTRIPSKELNIWGGSYIIPREELPQFYELYYHSVFIQKNN